MNDINFFISFCDDGNCRAVEDETICIDPAVKAAYVYPLNDLTNITGTIKSIYFDLEIFDRFHRFGTGNWKLWIRLNKQYEFINQKEYIQDSEYWAFERDVSDLNMNIEEFKNGMEVECQLLLNNTITCPLILEMFFKL